MLGDAKLNYLDTRLEQFKLSNQTSQNELQVLLREYGQLLEDCNALRKCKSSELPNNSMAASITHTPAPEKFGNPYVLVLVDGNGYIFNDQLVKDKEEGGMCTARMLNDAVEKFLKDHPVIRDSRVLVRVYADMTNLSKQLAKTKLIGLEKRSLMPFAAGFTRALGGFDFMDSLDEEGTRFKIRDAFKFAIEDAACSHILFAACHDISYLSQLVPYTGQQNKITLVQGAGFDEEFYKLGLTLTQFPTIFRWSDLTTAPSMSKDSLTMKAPPIKASVSKTSALDREDWRHKSASVNGNIHDSNDVVDRFPDITNDDPPTKAQANKKTKPCRYFQKSVCRWGNKCNFIHTPDHATTGVQTPSSTTTIAGIDRRNVSGYLPTTIPDGFIALNKDFHRLDVLIRQPTAHEWLTYNSRFHKQKPCNAHHLSGKCTNFNCPFDHHPLEVETQHCLEYVLKCSQCPRKGACRDKDCFHGHICQKDGCVGFAKGCKLKADAHGADPNLVSMVPAVAVEDMRATPIDLDVSEAAYEGSSW